MKAYKIRHRETGAWLDVMSVTVGGAGSLYPTHHRAELSLQAYCRYGRARGWKDGVDEAGYEIVEFDLVPSVMLGSVMNALAWCADDTYPDGRILARNTLEMLGMIDHPTPTAGKEENNA